MSRFKCASRAALALLVGLSLLASAATGLASGIQEDILAQTAAIRGLQPNGPVPLDFVDQSKVRADILESVNGEEAVREIEISRKVLVLLGLIKPTDDLRALLTDAYADNILGYYNHKDKRMYVVSGKEQLGAGEKVTLAHEFTHALQDQKFNLHELEQKVKENGDRSVALSSLIEGDATLTMLLFAREHLTNDEKMRFQTESGSGSGSIDRLPPILREEMLFPYTQGMAFVMRLWRDGGFEAVNRAFASPPVSSEQIIHPEKYTAGEQPLEPNLPDLPGALGAGWKQSRADVLGELDMRLILEPFTGPVVANRAAEGWGGDRYALLESEDGKIALVIDALWDSESDAVEFWNGYRDSVGKRFGSTAKRQQESPERVTWSTPEGFQLVARRGNEVIVLITQDEPALRALAARFGLS